MSAFSTIQIAFILMCSLFFAPLTAQKQLDSILEESRFQIYENPKEVIRIGDSIFTQATQPETKSLALMFISTAYLSMRENEKSLQYSLKAQNYFEEIEDVKSKIQILNSLGMQHQQLRIYDQAIEYLNQALELAKNNPNDTLSKLLGYNYAVRGFIYREQMSCETAIGYFDKAISEYKKNNLQKANNANLSTLSYNKGNCFLQLSQIDSARTNFETAIKYAQSVNANSLYAFGKKGLSEVFTLQGKYSEAIKELKEAESISENVGDQILNQGIYRNLSNNYLALNDREQYRIYFQKFSETQKSISEKEQKTINNSIQILIDEINSKTQKQISNLQFIQLVLTLLIIFLIIILGKLILKNKSKYKSAKKSLETFKY